MNAMIIPFGKGVRVRWMDSSQLDGWQYNYSVSPPGEITTLGLVIKSSEVALTISAHISPAQRASAGSITIPWGAIVEVEELPENYSLDPSPPDEN